MEWISYITYPRALFVKEGFNSQGVEQQKNYSTKLFFDGETYLQYPFHKQQYFSLQILGIIGNSRLVRVKF